MIDIRSKKLGVVFLSVGFLGISLIVVYMAMWPHFREYAGNQISGINYLAYFTYLSNLIVAVWLMLTGFANIFGITKLQGFLTSPKVFGAVVLYIFVVGFVFYGFLRWMITPFPWRLWYARLIDFANHGVFPAFMTVLFLLARREPKQRITQKHLLIWLIFPLVYLMFSLIRGAVSGWYPYPFFDSSWEVFVTLNISKRPLFVPIVTILFGGVFYLIGLLVKLVWNKKNNKDKSILPVTIMRVKYHLREIMPHEISDVAGLIAKGYEGDKFFEWVVWDNADRHRVVSDYYKVYLRAKGAVVHIAESSDCGIIGAAVWLPHDVDYGMYDEINAATGVYACNFDAVADASHKSEPSDIPFYQLVGFVVDKRFRSSGIGEALLGYQLDRLDKLGIATYLEASTPYHGKGVYGKFGYELFGELLRFADTAVLYPLFRKAGSRTWLEEYVVQNKAPYPIIGDVGRTTPMEIDLGENSVYFDQIRNKSQRELSDFLAELHKQNGVLWSISGDREYRKSLYRHADEEWVSQGLTLHAGVDIIVPKGTAVYAPYDGEITHVLYEDCAGGYGWIAVLKVGDFCLLFGHLAEDGLPKVGDRVVAGDSIGTVGDYHENGNWFYHIHFQAMSLSGIDEGLVYEALFDPDDIERADKISPSVMPIIRAWN